MKGYSFKSLTDLVLKIFGTKINAGTGLSGGGSLEADRTLSVKYGTTAGTSTQGNDSRVVNAASNATVNAKEAALEAKKADKTVTITAGTGLSGGGTLAASRSLAVKYGTTAGTAAQGDDSRIVNAASTSYVDSKDSAMDTKKADKSITISAGTGLSGGGTLAANRSLAVVYGTAAGTAAQGNDSRLSNSREWTAGTIPQAEAEAGTATTRRAFTAQRVRQAIVAWFNGISGALGRTILTRTTAAQVRSDIGLGTAATRNVGTASGNVMEVGAFGLGGQSSLIRDTKGSSFSNNGRNEFFYFSDATTNKPSRMAYGQGISISYGGNNYTSELVLGYRNEDGIHWRGGYSTPNAWQEIHHTGNLLQSTGTSTTFPMSQKAVTDALNTKAPSSHTHSWSQITGKPTSFTPSSHTHPWAQVTGQPATATRWPAFTEVTGRPANYPTTWASVAAKPAQATRWPSFAEVTGKPSTYAPSPHTHPISQITGLAPLLIPTGAVQAFAMNSAPTGWLKANGAAVSRTTYAALFAAIGTTYGVGNGSSTFNLPDLRGEFVRGWDDGRGVDPSRLIGSAQKGTHVAGDDGIGNANTVSPNNLQGTEVDSPDGVARGVSSTAGSITNTSSSTIWGQARPRNVALLYCIKY